MRVLYSLEAGSAGKWGRFDQAESLQEVGGETSPRHFMAMAMGTCRSGEPQDGFSLKKSHSRSCPGGAGTDGRSQPAVRLHETKNSEPVQVPTA